MPARKNPDDALLAHRSEHGLAVLSAALVRRGLRDLARTSNWLIRKIFLRRCPALAVSADGAVCGIFAQGAGSLSEMIIFHADSNVGAAPLPLPARARGGFSKPAAMAWSPDGAHLLAAGVAGTRGLHLFDAHRHKLKRSLNASQVAPDFLAWSNSGKFVVATSAAGEKSQLQLWKTHGNPPAPGGAPSNVLGPADWLEGQAFGEEFRSEGEFAGYGRVAFRPDEEALAVVVQRKGEWADDSLLICEVPSLRRRALADAQGRITDLHWTHDAKQIIFCAGGQSYSFMLDGLSISPLPFAAELCRCHPFSPLCACYNSWLKHTAKGRLFIVGLDDMQILDECPAEGIADLCWSRDGSKLYAVAEEGLSYVYDRPLA